MKVDNIRHGVFYHRIQLLREAHAGISVCASRFSCKRIEKQREARTVFTAHKTLTINLLTKTVFGTLQQAKKSLAEDKFSINSLVVKQVGH